MITLRQARRSDASDMAVLVDTAGFGLPVFVWRDSVERGEADSVLEAGRARALRDEGSFSWHNAVMAEFDGHTAGLLVGYRQPDEVDQADPAGVNPVFRPLVELEALAPATWYVNAVATFPEFRGRGVGSALVAKADRMGADTGAAGVSLIVQDDNVAAIRFYERSGFRETARRPFVPFPGCRPARTWVLMIKPR